MGFGILFIGYFLLLNFSYFVFTDMISGVILLYSLYKLSSVNRDFKWAAVISGGFTLFGAYELIYSLLGSFVTLPDSALVNSISSVIRVLLTGAITLFMLRGMQRVSREVKLFELSAVSERLSLLTFPVYGLKLALEIIGFFSLKGNTFLLILSVISIVTSLTLTVLILIRIYGCYMRICMPEDLDTDEKKKKNESGFVGAFRRHQEEKEREYAEYRLEKFKKKMEKKKGKTKK